jgi:hypothetical protein
MTGAASAAALLLSIGLLCARRIDTAAALCGLQAVCAAVAFGHRAVPFALLALSLNGVVLPLAIARFAEVPALTLRGGSLAPWVAALLVVVAPVAGLAKAGTDALAAVGTSVTLLGLLFMAVRRGAFVPALSVLSSQNGLILLAGAQPFLPPPVAAAVALPVIPALVLAEQWLQR